MIGSFTANGNIPPSRFVKMDSSGDRLVLLADAGAKIIGISQAGKRRAPYSTLDDGYAAIATEDLEVFQDDEEPWLEIAATVAYGDRLKSDANGKGTPVTANNDEWGAVAQQAGVSGQLIRVLSKPLQQYGA